MFDLPDQFTAHFLARLEELRIRTRRQYAGMGKGAHLSPKRGSSLEFNDYRHYAPGDDFRHIDWGLYGRTDKYYIKLFKEEEDLLTYIFLDASASMTYPAGDRKFEYAVATALALAYVALGSGDRVMIRLLGGSGGLAPAFVRKLREVSPGGQYDFAPVLAREMLSIRRAGKVFVISDFLMMLNSVTKGLGLFLAASMDLTAVQILGGRELKGHGLDGDVEVIDSESGERVRVAIGVREREQYQETLMRLTREIRSFCLKRGLHYSLYVTDREFQSFFLRAVAELGLAH